MCGAFTLPGYPTVRVITDYALTEIPDGTHGPLIGSSAATGLVFGEGPTMAAQYRGEAKGFDGYIIPQVAGAKSRDPRRHHKNLHLAFIFF